MATIINGSTNTSVWGFRLEVNELSYSIEDNTSLVTVEAFFGRPTSASYQQGANASVTVTIAGLSPQTIHYTAPGRVDYAAGQYRSLGFVTFTVPHDADGKKTIAVSASFTQNVVQPTSGGASGSVVLTAIPRYAAITLSLPVSPTETTAAVNWKTDYDVSALSYSLDNGSTWYGVTITDSRTGSFALSGLTANTAYSVTVRVTRADSGKTSNSAPLTFSTIRYPYADTTPDFVIGDYFTIGLFNPKGRSVTVEIIAAGQSVATASTSSDTLGFDSSVFADDLYTAIPSASSGTYSVRVTYGSQVSTETGGTFRIDPSVALPTISASYKDTNATVTAITSDDQIIVQGHSVVQYLATASGYQGASIVSVAVTVNETVFSLALSSGVWKGGNAALNVSADVPAVFTVTDSRGVENTATVTVHVAAWSIPSAICDVHRVNNFDTATSIKADARYSSVDGTNTISISYKYRQSGTGSWSSPVALSDDVAVTQNLDNAYSWDVLISVADAFGGSASYSFFVAKGIPIAYFDRFLESFGVNCFPSRSHSVEASGFNLVPSVMTRYLDTNVTTSANTRQKVNFDAQTTTGDNFTTTNDGGVKIGAGISRVMISAAINFTTTVSGERDIRIRREYESGGTTQTEVLATVLMTSSGSFSVLISPFLAEVKENDVIYLTYYTPGSDTIGTQYVNLTGKTTYLTVETKG